MPHLPSLADLVNAAKQDLPVTMRHERWLIDGAQITPAAAHFAQQALTGKVGGARARQPLFRASGMGSCMRKQIFSRAGVARREVIDGKTSNVFLTGNFIHLKWQVSGISAGWIKEAEVPVDRLDLNYGGTMDGVLDDDTGLEIKSINTRGFSMVTDRRKPTEEHMKQTTTYMILRNIDTFSVVYEDKNTQEWKEFRIKKEPEYEDAVLSEMEVLNTVWNNTHKLPGVKPNCQDKTGFEYNGCPFRNICPNIKEWPA